MRAQSKVRENYVVIRLTHKQLLAVDDELQGLEVLGSTVRELKAGREIIRHAVGSILRGERGDLSRAGMLIKSPRRNKP